MVVGFVSCVLSGALRAALLRSGPLVCKLVSNVLWRAVRLGQQKGRLIGAAHRGWFCPLVGYLNLTKSCAIRPIIARRTGVGKRSFRRSFSVSGEPQTVPSKGLSAPTLLESCRPFH